MKKYGLLLSERSGGWTLDGMPITPSMAEVLIHVARAYQLKSPEQRADDGATK